MQETISPDELADQLACPSGNLGETIGELLFEGNRGMIEECIQALKIGPKNRILELGQGNGAHVPPMVHQFRELKYFGLEVSEAMNKACLKRLHSLVNRRQVWLSCYDGKQIPFVHRFFHRIFTVNTLYFWQDPDQFLCEIYRVLHPQGSFVTAFVDSDSMKDLPFVNKLFHLYQKQDFLDLVNRSPFELDRIETHQERTQSKTGEAVERIYFVARLVK